MESLPMNRLADIVEGAFLQGDEVPDVTGVTIDSRHIGNESVFFALKGTRTDGHLHLAQAFDNGASVAVVSRSWTDRSGMPPGKPVIEVAQPLAALQKLAAWWRGRLTGKVIGITGSNGKTIVKDSLLQTLAHQFAAAGNPGSHNSQLGVPLSILRVPVDVDYTILEAGISEPDEMLHLESMIRPDFGILTNIGMAHIDSFGNQKRIAAEKIKLFQNIPATGWVIMPDTCRAFYEDGPQLSCEVHYFGCPSKSLPYITDKRFTGKGVLLTVRFPDGSTHDVIVNTPSLEIISDIEATIGAAYLLGVEDHGIAQVLENYEPSNTRMEIWRSPSGTTLINDSCSSDPISVRAALRSLERISDEAGRKIFVFGGMRELGGLAHREHLEIGKMAGKSSVQTLVLVGGHNTEATREGYLRVKPKGSVVCCGTTKELAGILSERVQPRDTLLFKGPRNTGIDRVAREITGVIAPDRLIVDIQAVSENILRFRRKIGSPVKVLGMVKALAYGSNLIRLSKELQNIGLDYLGVSTPDEGIQLRQAGVDIPILVMICTPDEAGKIVQNNLSPVIYSFDLVPFLVKMARKSNKTLDVHLKVDTGMGRLGVMPEQLVDLAEGVDKSGCLKIVGLMTHFACAEDPSMDAFTTRQIELFKTAISDLHKMGHQDIICHAAATAGAARFPESCFDMVRIGLGLYGVYPSPAVAEEIKLDLAVSLISRIAEIRYLNKGHIIGYGATFEVPCDNFKVGVVPIGYHDGLPLILSNNGHVLVNGRLTSIIGRISMDSMTIDLNHVSNVQQGADVLIYGSHAGHVRRPEEVAEESQTIAYELLTRLGPRIQRIYMGQ